MQQMIKSDADLSTPVISPVTVHGVTKQIAGQLALNDITLSVNAGETFGIIGPDGAGKTTLFNVIMGLLNVDQGSVSLLGQQPKQARARVSYLTQKFSCYLDLTVEENLSYAASIRGVSSKEYKLRKSKYLNKLDLARFSDRRARDLSGGMKQKLALCCALISEPEVLVLDEPTTGVDPVSRREFWDLLLETGSEITVVVSTPYLDEAERCSRIALMHRGSITDIGTAEELKNSLGMQRLQLRADNLLAASALLSTSAHQAGSAIVDVQSLGGRIDVLTHDSAAAEKQIQQVLSQRDIRILSKRITAPSLESVFAARAAGGVAMRELSLDMPGAEPLGTTGTAIETRGLTKRFGAFTAVDSLDLSIEFGQIYGLLGANGAGKTTAIKMMCGLLEPTSGNISLGQRADLEAVDVRQNIGYMSQKFTLYDDLTVSENLDFYAGVYSVPKEQRPELIEWVLGFAELSEYGGTLTGELPGGWKQRVAFGASIMHQPSIVFLDEPTSGMDPLARRQTWQLIQKLAQNGAAILVSTHYMDEAEHCHEIGFMADGKLLTEGSPETIRSNQPGRLYEVRTDDSPAAATVVRTLIEPWKVAIFADSLHVILEDGDPNMEAITGKLIDSHIKVIGVEQIEFSLEDAFIRIVSGRAR